MARRGKDSVLTEITNKNCPVDKKSDLRRVVYVYSDDLIAVCDQLPKVQCRVHILQDHYVTLVTLAGVSRQNVVNSWGGGGWTEAPPGEVNTGNTSWR